MGPRGTQIAKGQMHKRKMPLSYRVWSGQPYTGK